MNGFKSGRKVEKTLEIINDKIFTNMYRLQFLEGGRLPENLSGIYNKRQYAQKDIDNYLEGYTRNKTYPSAPKNDIPQRVKPDGQKDTGRVQ